MKIAITDVETTGLDADINEIIEIGLVIFDDQSFEILETMDVKVKPLHPEINLPKAYEINGYTEEGWKNAKNLEDVLKEYVEKTQNALFCAHNLTLDWDFITKAFKKHGIENYFDKKKIDIFNLAWAKIPHSEMKAWRLTNICEYLDIPPEPTPHKGIDGAMTEYKIYKKLME